MTDDNEFAYMTLAWKDGRKFEAHKVILAGQQRKFPTLIFEVDVLLMAGKQNVLWAVSWWDLFGFGRTVKSNKKQTDMFFFRGSKILVMGDTIEEMCREGEESLS